MAILKNSDEFCEIPCMCLNQTAKCAPLDPFKLFLCHLPQWPLHQLVTAQCVFGGFLFFRNQLHQPVFCLLRLCGKKCAHQMHIKSSSFIFLFPSAPQLFIRYSGVSVCIHLISEAFLISFHQDLNEILQGRVGLKPSAFAKQFLTGTPIGRKVNLHFLS